jgi:hypothetical protein
MLLTNLSSLLPVVSLYTKINADASKNFYLFLQLKDSRDVRYKQHGSREKAHEFPRMGNSPKGVQKTLAKRLRPIPRLDYCHKLGYLSGSG